jgi:ABC-2 type transport system permease protein
VRVGRDTWVVFRRYFRRAITSPLLVSVSLIQPLLYLLLFAPLLRSVSGLKILVGSGAYDWFVPGLLIQIAIFSISSGGWSLIAYMRCGRWPDPSSPTRYSAPRQPGRRLPIRSRRTRGK